MILRGAEVAAFCAKPDARRTGVLLYGADAMRVALRRQDLIAGLIGPEGEAEMRLTRMSGGDLRRDPAALVDAMQATGFFPGPRVVFVEDATDGLAKLVAAAFEDWREGDAMIVMTANQLTAKSALRKAFESHRNTVAGGIYSDPPSRAEIEGILQKSGLAAPAGEAMEALGLLAQTLDPGDFRQTVEKIALYKLGDPAPLTADEVLLNAPQTTEAEMDDLIRAVAEGQKNLLGPLMAKLTAQGIAPVTLCIGATRHFRTLHAAASHPQGPAQGIGTLRPPVFGPRRDQMQRQAQNWGLHRLEAALAALTDTDLALRSANQTAPQMALVERTLIRLTMMSPRG